MKETLSRCAAMRCDALRCAVWCCAGRGRGVVVTAPVAAGDLLMVARAVGPVVRKGAAAAGPEALRQLSAALQHSTLPPGDRQVSAPRARGWGLCG